MIVMIVVLFALAGGVIYGYYAGLFVSLEKISSEAFTSIQNSKSVAFDNTINIELPAPDPNNKNAFSLDSLGIVGISRQISVTTKGTFDRFDPNNIKFDVTASLDLGGLNAEGEMRIRDNTLYATLLKTPNLAYTAFLSPYMNKWYSFALNGPTNPASALPLMSMVGIDQGVLDKLSPEQKDYILNLAKNASFIKIVKKFSPESINNVSSYHFTFALDQVGIKNYLTEVENYLHESGKNDSFLSSFSTKNIQAELDKPINLTGEAWIGRNDHRPYKIVLNLSLDKILGNTFPIIITDTSIFKDWDVPADVVAPTDATTFESLMNQYSQGAQEKSADVMIKSSIKSALSQADIFHNKNKSSYKGFCNSSDFKTLLKNMTNTKGITCKDATTSYAISAMLSDKSYWCADSKGFSGLTKKPITTTSCPK